MKKTLISILLLSSTLMGAQDIKLPAPAKAGGMSLMQALSERQSSRSFSDDKLTEQQLSDMLWAAFGYTREGKKHTAPSSMNYQEIQIYVALADGLYLYEPKENILLQKSNLDVRSFTGGQDFVKGAPVNIVYVANYADNDKINADNWLHYSYANVGFISQNIYLYCASEGLGTVVRGWFDKDELKTVLKLHEDNVVILCQTVGVVQE